MATCPTRPTHSSLTIMPSFFLTFPCVNSPILAGDNSRIFRMSKMLSLYASGDDHGLIFLVIVTARVRFLLNFKKTLQYHYRGLNFGVRQHMYCPRQDNPCAGIATLAMIVFCGLLYFGRVYGIDRATRSLIFAQKKITILFIFLIDIIKIFRIERFFLNKLLVKLNRTIVRSNKICT